MFAVFLAAETDAFFLIDGRIPFWDVLGDLFFVIFFGVGTGRVLFVIGDISSVEFVARGVSTSSSIGVDVPCWWLLDDGPDRASSTVWEALLVDPLSFGSQTELDKAPDF